MEATLEDTERGDEAARARRQVVLFTSSYCMGGIEAHLTDLTRGLKRRGWDVALICSSLDSIEPLRRQVAALGSEVWVLPEANRPWHLIERAWRMMRVLQRHRGAIVHLHLQGDAGGLLVLAAARVARAAAAVRTLHNPPVPPVSRRLRAMVRLMDRLVDRVICVSPETQRAQSKEFKRDATKLVVIPNGVDIERFSPAVSGDSARAELGLGLDTPVVGTVARLQEERKGVGDFIAMASRVADRWPRARFLVVGDGPLRTNLEEQSERLGLGSRVIFTGYRRDVPRLLAAMNVAVFPSSYEAAQYVMLEAMAMARPIVITPSGLAVDVIEHDVTGKLVGVHDIDSMADAVDGLLSDPEAASRMGQAARNLILSAYSTDAMVNAAAGLYSQLLDRGSNLAATPGGLRKLR